MTTTMTKTKAAVATLAAGALIPALGALPAGAQEGRGEPTSSEAATNTVFGCNSGFYCFYTRVNYDVPQQFGYKMDFGTGTTFADLGSYSALEGPTGTWQDNVESVNNNTTGTLCLYNDSKLSLKFEPGAFASTLDLTVFGLGDRNNTIDYFKFIANGNHTCPSK